MSFFPLTINTIWQNIYLSCYYCPCFFLCDTDGNQKSHRLERGKSNSHIGSAKLQRKLVQLWLVATLIKKCRGDQSAWAIRGEVRVDGAELTICLKTLESLVLEKDLSGTQRGIRPSEELALARCILAIMAFSSFCKGNLAQRERKLNHTPANSDK